MTEPLLQGFIALLVVIDPVGQAPIFAGLTRGYQRREQRGMALRGILIATIVLYLFAFGGNLLMSFLGIGMPAFRIAGGLLLFFLAVDMLFARESGLRSTTEPEKEEAGRRRDISVFPLAIPLIAGPGAMTTILLLMGQGAADPYLTAGMLAVLALVLGLTLISLLFAVRINALLGVTGANVISRVLGIILAALAVQFILDGIQQALPFLMDLRQ